MNQQRAPLPPLPTNPMLPPKPEFTSFSFTGAIARKTRPSKLLSRIEQAGLQIASASVLNSASPTSQPSGVNRSLDFSVQTSTEFPSFAPSFGPDAPTVPFDEAMEVLAPAPEREEIQSVSLPDTSGEVAEGHLLDRWSRNTTLLRCDDIELHAKQVTDEWAQVVRAPLQASPVPGPTLSFSSPLEQDSGNPLVPTKSAFPLSSCFSDTFQPTQGLTNHTAYPQLETSASSRVEGREDNPLPHEGPRMPETMEAQPSLPTPTSQVAEGCGKPQTDGLIDKDVKLRPADKGASNRPTDSALNGRPRLSLNIEKGKHNIHRDPNHEPSPPSASSTTAPGTCAINRSPRFSPSTLAYPRAQSSYGHQLRRRSASPPPRNSRSFAFSPSRSHARQRSSSPPPRGTYRTQYMLQSPRSRRIRDSPPHLYRNLPSSTTSRHLPPRPRRSSPPSNRLVDYFYEPYRSFPPSRDNGHGPSRFPEAPLPRAHYERPRSPVRSPIKERFQPSIHRSEQKLGDFEPKREDTRSTRYSPLHNVGTGSYTRPENPKQGISYKRSREDTGPAPQNDHAEPVPKRQRTVQTIQSESIPALTSSRDSHIPNQSTNKSQSQSRSTSPQGPAFEKKGKLWNMLAGGSNSPTESVDCSTLTGVGPSAPQHVWPMESVPLQERMKPTIQQPMGQIPKAGLAERLGGVQNTEVSVQHTTRTSPNSASLVNRINRDEPSAKPTPSTQRRANTKQETLAQRMSLEQPNSSSTLISRLS
ncbi:hypothetical protein PIIN_05480 [Serendipita indica DSM 11827]|uniref:Uncharacterized protein n=1 Tax=Serendipita indica (strain DSM 11827) TaxID=1109443 RepID=G4TJQ1_SERID|nr:hypothetical protein PIIN_05480 [Serendipita indica DSM 11827]